MVYNNFRKEFRLLLEKTIFPGNMDEGIRTQQWKEVVSYVISHIPQKLFRFRAFNEDSVSSFEKETITLVRPDMFADEYDSLVYVDTNGIDDYIKAVLHPDSLKNFADFCRKEKQVPSLFSCIFNEEYCQSVLENILSISETELGERIKNIQLWDVTPVQDFIKQNSALAVKVVKENPMTKIACFTEDIYAKIMWDRYADGYKGFALEYDFSNYVYSRCGQCPEKDCPNRVVPNFFPVIYSDTRYDATAIAQYYSTLNLSIRTKSENRLPFPDTLFWIKAFLYKDRETYAYEKEWRFMCCCEGQKDKDYIELEKFKLKAIYYGIRMAPEHKKILRELAKAKQIREYEMYVDNQSSSYLLNYKEI